MQRTAQTYLPLFSAILRLTCHPCLACRKHPDNHVFRALAALCAPGVDAPQLTKDVTQRLGGRGGLPELCRQLSARLAPGLLSPATLAAATSLLIENGPDDDFGQALLKLLGDAVAANPHPFATMADQVRACHCVACSF